MLTTRLLPSLTVSLLTLLPNAPAQTASPTVIYTFPANAAGQSSAPLGTLIKDSAGNFYGTTQQGGADQSGSVYKVTPAGVYTTLYSFTGGADGENPVGGLVRTSDGTLYGTTSGNGSTNYGTVYKLTSSGVLTTLHTFNLTDGRAPEGSLLLGQDGKYYGTSIGGGVNNTGTLYSITTSGVFTLVHSFVTANGTAPQSAVIQISDGTLYGTTAFNGTPTNRGTGNGTIYSIRPDGSGFKVVHQLDGTHDGNNASASLVQGSDGAFYGVTAGGGANSNGTVFKVTSAGVFTVLHTFSAVDSTTGKNADGNYASAALIDGGDGKFYGSTGTGGTGAAGTVFSVTPAGVFTTLYDFTAASATYVNAEGGYPFAAFLKGADGRFYVPLPYGGVNGLGTIAAFTLYPAHEPFFTGEAALPNGVFYLAFATGNPFGYYSYLSDQRYLYHFDLGYEYIFDAADGKNGVYLYDFKSDTYFYTSPSFPFPYLYDLGLKATLYYYPDTKNPGHYTTNPRYFFNFATGKIITK